VTGVSSASPGWSLARGKIFPASPALLLRHAALAFRPEPVARTGRARHHRVARLAAPDARNSRTSLFNSPASLSQADPEPCAPGNGRGSIDGRSTTVMRAGDSSQPQLISFLLRARTRNGRPVGVLVMRLPNSTRNFDLTDQ
jgi:hypothetical protein